MNLNKIAGQAGLGDKQRDHFFRGFRGETQKPLRLSRDNYTSLQHSLEEGVVQVAGSREMGKPRFAYFTKRPLTPIYTDHPRHEIVRTIFHGDESLGISVIQGDVLRQLCNDTLLKKTDGVAALTSEQRREIVAFLRAMPNDDLISMTEEPVSGQVNFMALTGFRDYREIAFLASQLVSEQAQIEGGVVLFGPDAERLHIRATLIHEMNKEAGNNRQAILEVLERDLR